MRPAPRGSRDRQRSGRPSAVECQEALRSRAAPGWWLGLGAHVAATTTVCTLPAPRAVPAGLRIEARSNLAKSYIAQAILLAMALTSQRPLTALVARCLLISLVIATSIQFDWPDPPLLKEAPALVFPGALPAHLSEAEMAAGLTQPQGGLLPQGDASRDERAGMGQTVVRLVGLLLLAKLLGSQSSKSAIGWGAAFFVHCSVAYVSYYRSQTSRKLK